MLKYIIRLDDACPYMNKEKWDRMESLLDKYDIKPIVGIIPKCEDESFKNNQPINDFWIEYALKWQEKKWIIAQHGLNHNLSSEIRTEFANKSYDEQLKLINNGYNILTEKGIDPICFFAPNHTFDDNTIKAINKVNVFDFISDGYAFFPYKYNDMLFLPSVFDTPHKIFTFGIWTFVFHPNNMNDIDFKYLEKFILKNMNYFLLDFGIINKYKNRKRKLYDIILEKMIFLFRKVRNKNEK